MGSGGRRAHEMVRADGVELAASDLRDGADGRPTLVLLHGLGATQRSMAPVASRLTAWRVITFDLRGHGRSTTGPWSFDHAVADLDAVVAHFELDAPYVGGHSLGGMVALQYALAGRATPGVVNIDGWGPGVPARYLGEDESFVAEYLDQVATGHLASRLARVVARITRQGRQGTTGQVLAALDRADLVAWHRDAPCPSLAFNAVAPAPKAVVRLMGAEAARLQDAHRRGLQRDLAALADQRADVTVVEVDATHGLITTHPAVVAEAIDAFHRTTA